MAWFDFLVRLYRDYSNNSLHHRCRIIDVKTQPKAREVILLVLINGIKKQIMPYTPDVLVMDDAMLNEFSSFDVRAITFYALEYRRSAVKSEPKYSIVGQEFENEKTIFIIRPLNERGEQRKAAEILYRDKSLLINFSSDDLTVIISTAVQEQAMNDFKKIYG